jgi:hypothetical protein
MTPFTHPLSPRAMGSAVPHRDSGPGWETDMTEKILLLHASEKQKCKRQDQEVGVGQDVTDCLGRPLDSYSCYE